MNNYLILTTAASGSSAPAVFADAFGEMMAIHSIIPAKNATAALLAHEATGVKLGRTQVKKAVTK